MSNDDGWVLRDELNLAAGEDVPDVFLAFVEARAVHDFHHCRVDNRYQDGTRESAAYAAKIADLTAKINR